MPHFTFATTCNNVESYGFLLLNPYESTIYQSNPWAHDYLGNVKPRKLRFVSEKILSCIGGLTKQIGSFSQAITETKSEIYMRLLMNLVLLLLTAKLVLLNVGGEQALYVLFAVNIAVLSFAYLFLDRWNHILAQSTEKNVVHPNARYPVGTHDTAAEEVKPTGTAMV